MKDWKIGAFVHDMHYPIPSSIEVLPGSYVRVRLEWQSEASKAWWRWLTSTRWDCGFTGGYDNKYLMIVGESDDEGYWPCAWCYDGTSGGMVKVRPLLPCDPQ